MASNPRLTDIQPPGRNRAGLALAHAGEAKGLFTVPYFRTNWSRDFELECVSELSGGTYETEMSGPYPQDATFRRSGQSLRICISNHS